MPDPTRPGRAALQRVLGAATAPPDPEATHLRGTVSAILTSPPRVRVTVPGLGTYRCPYLAPYSPATNDRVWLARVATGSYLCLGREVT